MAFSLLIMLYIIKGRKMIKILFKELDSNKIKISWNKNPIKMELFLSFLTIPVERSYNHLGAFTGWTRLFNDNYNLEIGGGKVNDIEYLDSLKFGKRLSNPYNDYVNPFYLFDIFTLEGKQFFLEYYKSDINELIKDKKIKIEKQEKLIEEQKNYLNKIEEEYKELLNN